MRSSYMAADDVVCEKRHNLVELIEALIKNIPGYS